LFFINYIYSFCRRREALNDGKQMKSTLNIIHNYTCLYGAFEMFTLVLIYFWLSFVLVYFRLIYFCDPFIFDLFWLVNICLSLLCTFACCTFVRMYFWLVSFRSLYFNFCSFAYCALTMLFCRLLRIFTEICKVMYKIRIYCTSIYREIFFEKLLFIEKTCYFEKFSRNLRYHYDFCTLEVWKQVLCTLQ